MWYLSPLTSSMARVDYFHDADSYSSSLNSDMAEFNPLLLKTLFQSYSHSVLLSHHSHFLNLPLTLSISLSSHSNSPTCSQSLSQSRSHSQSPSCSRSRSVLSLLLTLCTLTLRLHLQFGITRYVSLSQYLFEHWGVRVICGYMSVFVGICGYL